MEPGTDRGPLSAAGAGAGGDGVDLSACASGSSGGRCAHPDDPGPPSRPPAESSLPAERCHHSPHRQSSPPARGGTHSGTRSPWPDGDSAPSGGSGTGSGTAPDAGGPGGARHSRPSTGLVPPPVGPRPRTRPQPASPVWTRPDSGPGSQRMWSCPVDVPDQSACSTGCAAPVCAPPPAPGPQSGTDARAPRPVLPLRPHAGAGCCPPPGLPAAAR